MITLTSDYGFDTTAARIKAALISHNMTIFADIDQAAAAESVGLHLRPTQLILFGNPKAGTPIMQANPKAALELPLRLVIWESDKGTVNVEFQDPVDILQQQYHLAPQLVLPLSKARGILEAALSHS